MVNVPRSDQPLWWQKGVVYQIYPRSYKDSNGDGIGDLAGIIEKLDYLSDVLGIDAIWLSPFYPSPMRDFGYDVANYTDVDPIFGDLKTFDRLVEEAHRRNIQIIIDFVPNHTSDEHPWFVESRASRTNPRRNWYIWADPKPDGSPPNNWLSVFGGSAWELDPTTGQYYLHSFLKEQPDLNWRNGEVRAAMLDAMRFWLDRGVDGFRVDVAHFMMKDPDLRDNPPNPDIANTPYKSMGDYDSQLHLHDLGHADIHDVLRDFRKVLDEYSTTRPRYSVGEIHIFDWARWASYYGAQLDELHMPFNFSLIGARWNAAVVRGLIEAVEAAVPAGAWPNWVIGNHDEHRIATRIGPAQARVAMMLLLTLRGTPTIYYGDEIGMHDVAIPPEKVQDPWGKRVQGLGLGRDPEPTPMQWDNSPNAGFCPPQCEPWLPVADDYRSNNAAAQLDAPGSMLTLSRRLLELRRAEPALNSGRYIPVPNVPDDCLAYIRERGTQRYLILLNFSSTPLRIALPEWGTSQIAISTNPARKGVVDLREFELAANEGCIVKRA
jgi:alpha-glucosidase